MGTMFEITDGPNKGKRFWLPHQEDVDYLTANKLAAISTALMCDTPTSMDAALLPEGHALDSAAYRDAVRTVRKVIELRKEVEEWKEEAARLRNPLTERERWKNTNTNSTA